MAEIELKNVRISICDAKNGDDFRPIGEAISFVLDHEFSLDLDFRPNWPGIWHLHALTHRPV